MCADNQYPRHPHRVSVEARAPASSWLRLTSWARGWEVTSLLQPPAASQPRDTHIGLSFIRCPYPTYLATDRKFFLCVTQNTPSPGAV